MNFQLVSPVTVVKSSATITSPHFYPFKISGCIVLAIFSGSSTTWWHARQEVGSMRGASWRKREQGAWHAISQAVNQSVFSSSFPHLSASLCVCVSACIRIANCQKFPSCNISSAAWMQSLSLTSPSTISFIYIYIYMWNKIHIDRPRIETSARSAMLNAARTDLLPCDMEVKEILYKLLTCHYF